MQRIIDTHIHVWDLNRAEYPWLKSDTSILNRTYTIEEIEEERKKAGVTAGVLVQASGNLEDTHLMFDSAKKTDWLKGVVAWLPLTDTQATTDLLQSWLATEKYFKGVRHQIHDEQDAKWLLQPDVISALKILAANEIPYDLVGILPAHIETALKVVEQVPNLKLVFDHLNWPPIPTKEKFGKWGELMKEAAKHKNLFAKISGLGTASGNFENRTADDIKPYVEFVLEHFSVERCFCGGDWPVSLLTNSYSGTWSVTKTLLNELLNEHDRNKVYFTNADKFYNLGLNR